MLRRACITRRQAQCGLWLGTTRRVVDVNSAGAVRALCLLGRCRNPHYFIRRITASSGCNCIYATPHPLYGPYDVFDAPIVSVSLAIPAVFLFGGLNRSERPRRIPLAHGDVVVWGGPARLRYHGVMPLKEDYHPALGRHMINLTFRKATQPVCAPVPRPQPVIQRAA